MRDTLNGFLHDIFFSVCVDVNSSHEIEFNKISNINSYHIISYQ